MINRVSLPFQGQQPNRDGNAVASEVGSKMGSKCQKFSNAFSVESGSVVRSNVDSISSQGPWGCHGCRHIHLWFLLFLMGPGVTTILISSSFLTFIWGPLGLRGASYPIQVPGVLPYPYFDEYTLGAQRSHHIHLWFLHILLGPGGPAILIS